MKKCLKLCLLIFVCVVVFYANPVLADYIKDCKVISPTIRIDPKIPNTVHSIIVAIKIIVPILLVVFGMIDLMKGVIAQKEDEVKKGQQMFIKRLISGALVFFVFTIVQLLISFVADSNNSTTKTMNCVNCFINGDCNIATQ